MENKKVPMCPVCQNEIKDKNIKVCSKCVLFFSKRENRDEFRKNCFKSLLKGL